MLGLHSRFTRLIHYTDITTVVDYYSARKATLPKNLLETFNSLLCQQDLIISRLLQKGTATRDAVGEKIVEEGLLHIYYM